MEDLIYFLEKEQLASVFWLEMMQQQQRLNRINILDNKQRVHHIICFLRERFGRESDLRIKLPKWLSAKLISQISYTRLSFVRNLFADLSKEGVISKSEGCWEVMLVNFGKVRDERRLNQKGPKEMPNGTSVNYQNTFVTDLALSAESKIIIISGDTLYPFKDFKLKANKNGADVTLLDGHQYRIYRESDNQQIYAGPAKASFGINQFTNTETYRIVQDDAFDNPNNEVKIQVKKAVETGATITREHINKTSEADNHIGDKLQFDVKLINNGKSELQKIQLAEGLTLDKLSMKLISADGKEVAIPQSAYVASTRTIKVPVTSLAAGENIILRYEVKINKDAAESLTNEATATAEDVYGDAVKIDLSRETIQVSHQSNETPVILANDVTLQVGDKFNPLDGVSAEDTEDGDLTKDVKVIENTVNTAVAGIYKVTYSVTDSNGNTATKTIQVEVQKDITINPMTELDDTVTGTAPAGVKLRYFVDGQAVNIGNATADGTYNKVVGLHKAGTVIGVQDPKTGKYRELKTITVTPVATKLTVNEMTTNDDSVTGTAPKGVKLRFLIDGKAVNVGYADADGKFNKVIGKQKAGTIVGVQMFDPALGNYSDVVTTTVKAVAAPVKVNAMTTSDTAVSGTAPAGSKLRIVVNGQAVNIAYADADGKFNKVIGTQKEGAVVGVELFNSNAGIYEDAVTVKVTGDTNLDTPAKLNPISAKEGIISGSVPGAIGQVRVWVNNVAQTVVAAKDGQFTWKKAGLKEGDIVKVDYKNAAGKWIAAEATVVK